MIEYTPPLARLIEELKRIPGIGRKSAQTDRFFPAAHRQEERPGAGRFHRPGARKDILLLGLQ